MRLSKLTPLEKAIRLLIKARNIFRDSGEYYPGVVNLLWDDIHKLLGLEFRPWVNNNELYDRSKEHPGAKKIYHKLIEGS